MAISWDEAAPKQPALQRRSDEVEALPNGIREYLPVEVKQPPLAVALETLQTLMTQELEPDPTNGGTRIREGVAKDRRISLEDDEMRTVVSRR